MGVAQLVQYLHLNVLSSVIAPFVILSIICHLSQLCLYLSDTAQRDICDIFGTAQRIVGQNGQKSMLACILQYLTGCSRTSWYFWHTAFTYYVWEHTKSFSDILNSKVVWVLKCRDKFNQLSLLFLTCVNQSHQLVFDRCLINLPSQQTSTN